MRLVSEFADSIGAPARTVERTIEVTAMTIDLALAAAGIPSPDFIKLDVHSAEYEALLGGRWARAGVERR